MRRNNRCFLVCLGLIVILAAVSLPVEAVSQLERRIARRNLQKYVDEYGLADLTFQEEERINNIFKRLTARAQKDAPGLNFRYYVINAPVINAAYLGDGRIIIFNELIKELRSDDQLAAIIAHEIGHGVNNDIEESLELMQTMQVGSILIDLMKDGRVNQRKPGMATSIAFNLLQKGYSRDQERDADNYSVFLLERANYDPQGVVEAMEFIKTKQKEPTNSRLLEILSTHPNIDNRINYLARLVSRLNKADELYYSPVATARRFIQGLLADNLGVVYSTYSEEVQEKISLKEFKVDSQVEKVRRNIKGLGEKADYNLKLRNQVEGTARVAIYLPGEDLALAVDLLKGKYGWKIRRGPFLY